MLDFLVDLKTSAVRKDAANDFSRQNGSKQQRMIAGTGPPPTM